MLPAVKGRSVPRVALFLFTAAFAFAQSNDLAVKSQKAKEYMGDGRFADAVPIYEELVKALPANPGLHLNLALALQMSGRLNDAVPEFQRVLKADPANLPALLSLGATHLSLNEPAKAIPYLEKTLTLQPADPNPRGMLANALLSLDRPKDAALHFRKLTTLTPADPKAWFGLGRCYEGLAVSAFDELAKTSPDSAEWLSLVAETRASRRQYRAAFYFYRKALEAKASLRGVHAALAGIYRATDHADWAEIEAKKEASLPAPNCAVDKPECDLRAGKLLDSANGKSPYWQTRAYNALALEAFTKLSALPESVELHSLLADVASGRGQFLDAAREWRAAMKLDPLDARLETDLAAALYQGHDYQAALPLLQAQVKRMPASAEFNFYLGDCYLRLEQPAQAIEYLETAAKLDPKQLPIRASLGLTLMKLDRPKEAVGHLDAALIIDDDGSLHYQLVRAYQASGDAEKAKEVLAEYQKIQQSNEAAKLDLDEKVKITEPR